MSAPDSDALRERQRQARLLDLRFDLVCRFGDPQRWRRLEPFLDSIYPELVPPEKQEKP